MKLNGLQVQGASAGFGALPAEIDFTGVSTGHVANTLVVDTCDASGGAEYGVNVYASGAVIVQSVTATGFSDAGVYVGGISSTGTGILLVTGNHLYGNSRA